eukprot:gene4273-4579_t
MILLDDCVKSLTQHFKGLKPVHSWGETALFYNPENYLPRGTYCFTFKEKDGENDSSSQLNRDEIDYRLNFKIKPATYLNLFHESRLPKRPLKGGIIVPESGRSYDPTVLNTLIPHPVYGWMSWVSIVNLDERKIQELLSTGLFQEAYDDCIQELLSTGLFQEAYDDCVERYNKHPAVRLKQRKRSSEEETSLNTQTKRKRLHDLSKGRIGIDNK